MGDPIQVKWEETVAPATSPRPVDHQVYQGTEPKGYPRASVISLNGSGAGMGRDRPY
jgi:hypothetical protein